MNRLARILPCLSILLTLPAAAAAPASAAGEFEIGRYGHVLVPVSINGAPARIFSVDTAASHIVLDRSVYADLVAEEPPAAGSATHGAHGAHGNLAATLTRLQSVSVWEEESQDLDAVLLRVASLGRRGPPDFDGVLGIPYLSRYLVDIDFETRRLALWERGGDKACARCTPLNVVTLDTLAGGLKAVRLSVDEVPMIAVLDTGAAGSVFNTAAVERLQDAGSAPSGSPHVTVAIGGQARSQVPRPAALDLPVFATLGLQDQPAMILGLDVLASGRLVLDLAGSTAWFLPQRPPGDA